MSVVSTRVRVRFKETDQMGVVYHSNYLVWMEVGRVEWLRSRGLRYRDIERDGVLMTVAEATCRYHAPARYDDEVEIVTSVKTAHSRMVKIGYILTNAETGEKLATGETTHVFCGPDLRPIRLPEKYREAFGVA
ncbi:MAG: thioesterase family protein [Acidobacteria bacterium]|nr:thioesterase family protein [Acidobacteriota bacterium]